VKLVGWLIAIGGIGGLIVLAVSGLSAATGVLVTAVAIFAMIALGGLLGGRNTPNRAPYDHHGSVSAEEDECGEAGRGPRGTS
jgi:hypothetical protein